MTTGFWCGLCATWGEHDTAHHGNPTGLVPGDKVRVLNGEWANSEGIVQRTLPNREYMVRIPGRRGNTTATTVHERDLKRIRG